MQHIDRFVVPCLRRQIHWPEAFAWFLCLLSCITLLLNFTAMTSVSSWVMAAYMAAFLGNMVIFFWGARQSQGKTRRSLVACGVSMLSSAVVSLLALFIQLHIMTYIVVAPLQELLLFGGYISGLLAVALYFPRKALFLGSTWHIILNGVVVGFSTLVILQSVFKQLVMIFVSTTSLNEVTIREINGMIYFISFDISLLFASFLLYIRVKKLKSPLFLLLFLSLLCLTAADILYLIVSFFSTPENALQTTIPLYILRATLWALGTYWHVRMSPVGCDRYDQMMSYIEWFAWTRTAPLYMLAAWACTALIAPAAKSSIIGLLIISVIRELATHQEHHLLRQLHQAKDELKQWLDVQATEVVSVAHDLARYSRDIFVALAWFKPTMTTTSQDDLRTMQIFERRVNVVLRDQRRLLENMQDAARIQGPGLPQHPQAIDLVELVTPLVQHFQDAALGESNPCSLCLHISPDLPPAWCDPDLLWRVVSNIIDNGLKYTREVRADGEVQVRLWAEGTWVSCQIVDNGKGIAPHDQARLGQRWARLAVGDHTPGGMGLGLSFCKAVIDASGGALTFQSQLGVGTTVTIQLLRAPHSAVQPTMMSPMSVIAGLRFLIIEDRGIGNELASLLQKHGACASVVINVAAAQQWLREQEPSVPHVAIIDYHLLGSVSGTTFAAWMQQQPHLQSTLRISWSALPRESICAGWIDNPHDPLYHGFIRKSTELTDVVRRLGNMVHHYGLNTYLRDGNHVEA